MRGEGGGCDRNRQDQRKLFPVFRGSGACDPAEQPSRLISSAVLAARLTSGFETWLLGKGCVVVLKMRALMVVLTRRMCWEAVALNGGCKVRKATGHHHFSTKQHPSCAHASWQEAVQADRRELKGCRSD